LVAEAPLAGLTIGITAERSAEQQVALFEARGADTVLGATLRISSLADDAQLRATTEELTRHPPDFVLASTGYGMRTWLEAAETWSLREPLLEALRQARVANRGAKAASANTGAGLREWFRAPDERFGQLVDRVLEEPLDGARLVLQLHGSPQPDAIARLRAAGAASVLEVDAYRSSLPTDSGPAFGLIDATCAERLAAVTFTTAPAVHNLFVLARERNRADDLRGTLNTSVVAACVGPVCAEGAREEGIAEPLVPARARLVPLVEALTNRLAPASTPPA
jgi:uroporphyrinogen-III synthase